MNMQRNTEADRETEINIINIYKMCEFRYSSDYFEDMDIDMDSDIDM